MMAENFLFYFFSSIALISGVMVIRSKNPVHSVLFLILVFCNAAGLLILLHLDFFAMIFLVVYVGAIAVLFLFVVMMLHIKLTEMNENILRYLPVGGIIGLIFLFEVLLVVENDLIPLFVDEQVGISIQNGGYFDFASSDTRWLESLREQHSFSGSVVGNSQSMQSILGSLIWDSQSFQYIQWPLKIENVTNIEALGQILYTYYFYFFILASLILLIAMIGAIVLTHRTKSNSFGLSESSATKHQEVFEQNTREFSKTIRKLRF
jgi:NADH-ubiquinone oxidoreductase chain 6